MLAGKRVPDLSGNFGEVAPPHLLGGHRHDRTRLFVLPDALKRAHEERAVVPVVEARDYHRPTQHRAELVALRRVLRDRAVLEIAAGVERFVLEKLVGGAVEVVRAALGDDVHVDAEEGAVSADVLPVWTCTSSTASWMGRMLVMASRFELELIPSSVMLFWILRWPAPRKLKPMSLVLPASTPGVVLASDQTLRP